MREDELWFEVRKSGWHPLAQDQFSSTWTVVSMKAVEKLGGVSFPGLWLVSGATLLPSLATFYSSAICNRAPKAYKRSCSDRRLLTSTIRSHTIGCDVRSLLEGRKRHKPVEARKNNGKSLCVQKTAAHGGGRWAENHACSAINYLYLYVIQSVVVGFWNPLFLQTAKRFG
jgi:hypothetical protein